MPRGSSALGCYSIRFKYHTVCWSGQDGAYPFKGMALEEVIEDLWEAVDQRLRAARRGKQALRLTKSTRTLLR